MGPCGPPVLRMACGISIVGLTCGILLHLSARLSYGVGFAQKRGRMAP